MDLEEYLRMQSQSDVFVQCYRCRPISFLNKEKFPNDGNRVIMPPSALDRLISLKIEFPMKFKIENPSTQKMTHCSVLEFEAEEGLVYIQSSMMERLGVRENDIVLMRNTRLPNAEFVKLQPHTMDFLNEVFNPRDVLESNFSKYPCTTVGDTITVTIAGGEKQYLLDVVEARPADAVSTLDTDCEVEFAPSLDYKEPEPVAVAVAAPAPEPPRPPSPFTGTAMRLDGKPVERPAAAYPEAAGGAGSSSARPKSALRFGSAAAGSRSTKGDGAKEKEKETNRFVGHKYTFGK